MKLFVVIPHHSRADLLTVAIESARGLPVVVADDSPGGAHAGVPSVRTRGNEGFAAAANRGIAHAAASGATHVLLLNDDAGLEPGCAEALAAAFTEGAGAVGPLLVGPEGLECGIRVDRLGRVRALRRVPPHPMEVGALSGACLLLDVSARFDERFRHGMEDVDLCLRLRAAGRRVVLVPSARCRHAGGGTLLRASREAQRHAVSGHLRLVGGGVRTPLVLALAAGQIVREGGPVNRFAGALDGWRDWRRR